jgi:hypothetical protein
MKPMKRIALYLFPMVAALCLVAIGHTTKTKRAQLSAEMRETEEYAVYSALLVNVEIGHALLIQNRTESAYGYDGSGDEAKYIKDRLPSETSEETLNDFKLIDRQQKELNQQFVLNHAYILVTQEERQNGFANRAGRDAFFQRYPDARGIFLLSRVGFNKNLDEALVHSWRYCGGDCGGGGFYLLRKQNGRWSMKQTKTWIS